MGRCIGLLPDECLLFAARRDANGLTIIPLRNSLTHGVKKKKEMEKINIGNHKILKSIFLTLDQRTLLIGAIRVCKQWHSTIFESTPLRAHLFLHPSAAPTNATAPRRHDVNPLLQSAFPLFFELPTPRPSVWASFAHQPTALPHAPLARQNLSAITRRGASWRRMLVCQPPVTKLGVIIGETAYFTDILSFPEGLQMRTLYDLIYKYSCRDDNPASWCMAWRPALRDKDDMWAVDDMVACWMEKNELELALFVVKFDAWGAKVMGSEDRRLEDSDGVVVDWEGMKCEEHCDVDVDAQFYFLPR